MPSQTLTFGKEMPTKQWAQQFDAQGSALVYTEIEVPKVSSDDVLVELKYSGVCHSDYHAWKGDWPLATKKHLVGGHEGSGVIIALGEKVQTLNIGDRVGIQWVNRSCGDCEFCLSNNEQHCPDLKMSGYTVDGTFQQYCVCKESNAVRIPAEVPLDLAAPILCAGVTVYRALKEANAKPGEIIAVAGAGGGLGSLACQYAKACGFRVLAISAGKEKKKMCIEQLGVDYFVDYKVSTDIIADVKRVTAGGPHAVLVVAAAQKPLQEAIQYIRKKGTVVAIGLPAGSIELNIFSTVLNEVNVKGSYVGSRRDTEEALEIFRISDFAIFHQVYSLAELPKIYDFMQEGTMQGRAILRIPEKQKNKMEHQQTVPFSMSKPAFVQEEYNVGTFLAYRLEEMGIKHYFVVPGDYSLSLIDQILKNEALEMVGCCNELNAGYAADGNARSSSARIAVVVVTFMVGGLSLLNAIAGAYSEGLKIIIISGCPPTNALKQSKIMHHTLGTKDKDQALRMFREVTAASVRLDDNEDPTQVLDEAISKCLEESLPVYIEIPADLAMVQVKIPKTLSVLDQPHPDKQLISATIQKIIKVWNCASRPILLVGNLVRHRISTETLEALIHKLGCAVFCQPDGKSIVPESDPRFAGAFWPGASEATCEETVMSSDLWIGLGTRWSDHHTLDNIDIAAESHRLLNLQHCHIDIPGVQSIKDIALLDIVEALINSKLLSNEITVRSFNAIWNNTYSNGVDHWAPLTTSTIVNGIQKILRSTDTLIAETGDSWFQAQHIKLPRDASFQMQLTYCSIGWSLPATLGCQLARPNGRAVLMIGDGSFQMTAQEISTMIRAKTNSVIFIFNNLGYGTENAIHQGPYNYISNWNYASFASTLCGMPHSRPYRNLRNSNVTQSDGRDPSLIAMQIKTNGELQLALERIERETDKLAIVECCIHPRDWSNELERFGSAVGERMRKISKTSI